MHQHRVHTATRKLTHLHQHRGISFHELQHAPCQAKAFPLKAAKTSHRKCALKKLLFAVVQEHAKTRNVNVVPVRLPVFQAANLGRFGMDDVPDQKQQATRSEEHTSELQSRGHLVCRLLLEKKN